MMKWLKHLCDGESAKVNVAPARDRIEDIHCFLDKRRAYPRENSRKLRSKLFAKKQQMQWTKKSVRIWCCNCVLRCSMSAWRRPFVTGIRTSGQNGLSTHFFMLSTLAQSTLGGLFGLFLLVVAKATYLTFPHVPTHSAAGSSASHWSLGFPRPPDRRHHRRISHFSVFPPT
jgi:hypothetical protein